MIEDKIDDVKIEIKDLIAKEDYHILVTHDGYLKRMTPRAYQANEEMKLKEGDTIIANFKMTSLDTLLLHKSWELRLHAVQNTRGRPGHGL